MAGEGGAELDDVGAVGADGLVEDVAGDVELLGPEGDVGGDLGVDLGVAGGDLVAVLGFGLFDGGGGNDVRHAILFPVLVSWMRMGVGGCTGGRDLFCRRGGGGEPADGCGCAGLAEEGWVGVSDAGEQDARERMLAELRGGWG